MPAMKQPKAVEKERGGSVVSSLIVGVGVAMMALASSPLQGAVDICGNEIVTYEEDGQTKTYQFILSGDPRITVGAAAVAAASHSRASTMDDGGGVSLEARCRKFLVGNGTRLWSTKARGVLMIVR